jgi:hypothetical protein
MKSFRRVVIEFIACVVILICCILYITRNSLFIHGQDLEQTRKVPARIWTIAKMHEPDPYLFVRVIKIQTAKGITCYAVFAFYDSSGTEIKEMSHCE